MLETLETPRLILDAARLRRNAERFLAHADTLGVSLRTHVKTSKCTQVADIAKAGRRSGITVSTLKEAEHFAAAGYSDILLAAGITPNKLDRVRDIQARNGQRLLLLTDDAGVARQAVTHADAHGYDLDFLIEIDCGEHRCGLPPQAEALLDVARILDAGARTHLRGVMTHAGHSYATTERTEVARIAELERQAAVQAAGRLRAANLPCEVVSVGSTPTFLWARSLQGVTEARCGIYLFWDLAQLSRNVCTLDDIALSVLATVIGHNRAAPAIVVDAGALALSKDTGANRYLPDAHHGYVCETHTLRRLGSLSINVLHQEHGSILVDDEHWFERLPVGATVRIVPNHACLTAAPYDSYTVIEDGAVIDEWPRLTGW